MTFKGLHDGPPQLSPRRSPVCRTGRCESLAESASVCATECTSRIGVSYVGREHRRRKPDAEQMQRPPCRWATSARCVRDSGRLVLGHERNPSRLRTTRRCAVKQTTLMAGHQVAQTAVGGFHRRALSRNGTRRSRCNLCPEASCETRFGRDHRGRLATCDSDFGLFRPTLPTFRAN